MRQRDVSPGKGESPMKINRTTFNNTAKVLSILMLAAASVVMGSGACSQVVGVPCRSADEAVQYVVNLVNADAGTTQSSQAGETTWTYSMAHAGPCTLLLTEEVRRVNTAVSGPTAPIREITYYLIPAADLDFGKFGTRLKLDRAGGMQVIINMEHASIRRWRGDPAVMPPDAPLGYETQIRFGKPYVDILDVTLRLEDALKYLGSSCRAERR